MMVGIRPVALAALLLALGLCVEGTYVTRRAVTLTKRVCMRYRMRAGTVGMHVHGIDGSTDARLSL